MRVERNYNYGQVIRLRFNVGRVKKIDYIIDYLKKFKSEEYPEGFDGACFKFQGVEYDFVKKSWGEIEYLDRMERDDFKLIISDVKNNTSFYVKKAKEKFGS